MTDRDDGRDGDGAVRVAVQMHLVVIVGQHTVAWKACCAGVCESHHRASVFAARCLGLLAARAKLGCCEQTVVVEEAVRTGPLAAQ